MSLNEKFHKKSKINTFSDSYTILITFQEIADIQNNKKKYKLLDPPFQVSLDENKVDEMMNTYITRPQFFLSKSIITIATVIVGNEKEFYLMDGQHRMEMIRNIYEKTNENNTIFLVIHVIRSEDEMRSLFEELNKDSSKSKPYIGLEIFSKIKAEELKKKLIKEYEGAFSKSKNKKSSLYTVDEFMNELIDNNYLENDKTVDEIFKNIDETHKKYFSKLKYLENKDDEKLYSQTEITAINVPKNVIFFKNNNFINHLVDNDYPTHDDPVKRKNIPNSMREEVWKKEFNNKKTGTCPVKYCNHQISNKKFGFQCGHMESVANGGKDIIDNLKPICADCNAKMSSTNWDEYEEKLEKENKWENVYGDENDGECASNNCTKKISKENFYLKKQKKKGKTISEIVCKKCYRS